LVYFDHFDFKEKKIELYSFVVVKFFQNTFKFVLWMIHTFVPQNKELQGG
jgi:hypothetical protein